MRILSSFRTVLRHCARSGWVRAGLETIPRAASPFVNRSVSFKSRGRDLFAQGWEVKLTRGKQKMNSRFSATRFASALFLCLMVLLAGTSAVSAQTASTGALTGTVTDQSGGVVSGATVTATNNGTGQSRTATTDSSGTYKFSLLNPGNYSVKFSANGFKTVHGPVHNRQRHGDPGAWTRSSRSAGRRSR